MKPDSDESSADCYDDCVPGGGGQGLARGQLHSRAVRPYNAVHRFWGPLALGALAALDVVSVGYLIGALTWALHIALADPLGTVSALKMVSSAAEQLTPRARQVLAVARELLEDEGLESLSMRNLAEQLGIRASHLYRLMYDRTLNRALLVPGSEGSAVVPVVRRWARTGTWLGRPGRSHTA